MQLESLETSCSITKTLMRDGTRIVKVSKLECDVAPSLPLTLLFGVTRLMES
jgi:hypothetical protein